jgi:hypothetical protein
VGDSTDLHVKRVRSSVENQGAQCLILDESVSCVRLSYSGSQVVAEAQFDGIWMRLDSAMSIWWWRKEFTTALAREDDFRADFIIREYRELLESFEWLLPAARWPIRPSAVRRANLKCHQLALAQQLGFNIPETIITNDAASAQRYVRADPSSFPADLIYKPLTWYVSPPDNFLYASLVTVDELNSSASSISVAPCQFQQYIPKSFEIRTTIVGADVFTVRIDSQSRADTRIDWRHNQGAVPYSHWDMPAADVALLKKFLQRCDLVYGVFDLIVSPDGRLTFLELNPMGQWLWLEDRLGLGISSAVAKLLIHG